MLLGTKLVLQGWSFFFLLWSVETIVNFFNATVKLDRSLFTVGNKV